MKKIMIFRFKIVFKKQTLVSLTSDQKLNFKLSAILNEVAKAINLRKSSNKKRFKIKMANKAT